VLLRDAHDQALDLLRLEMVDAERDPVPAGRPMWKRAPA